jgi:hypothetical protein
MLVELENLEEHPFTEVSGVRLIERAFVWKLDGDAVLLSFRRLHRLTSG